MLAESCMHIGMTNDDRMHFRINAETKREFNIAARLQGLKPSTFLHHLVVKAIQEAKREHPEMFELPTPHVAGKPGGTSISQAPERKKKRNNG